MKKALSILLAFLLLVAVLAGCNQKATSGDKGTGGDKTANTGSKSQEVTTIKFWGHVNESWNQSHQTIIDEFNASQDKIKVEATFFPYSDFEAKIQTSLLSGGEGADLYEIWGGWALDFIDANTLSPVPSNFMQELVKDCYPPVIGAFQGDDKEAYYGVPLEYNIEYGGLIINKPLFEEKNLKYPTTWDEMISIAKETAVANGEIMEMRGFDFTTNDTLTSTYLSMILSQGGEYLKDGKIVLNTPEGITSLQKMVDYVKVDRITNLDSATGALGEGADGHYFIGTNEAMMVPRGPWAIAGLETDFGLQYGKDFDYVTEPFYGSEKAYPAETGWGMCVPSNSKSTEAAWTYIEYFLQPEVLRAHNVRCGMVPPRKSIAEDPSLIEEMPFMQALAPILQYGKFIGPFNTDVFKKDLSQVFVSLCLDDGTYASVEEAVITLEEMLNKDLKLG